MWRTRTLQLCAFWSRLDAPHFFSSFGLRATDGQFMGYGPLRILVGSSAKFLIAIAVVKIKASRPLRRSDGHSSIVCVMCGRATVARCVCELSVSLFWHCLWILQSKECVVCLSRLVTRTKESNMCASHWENETQRRNESEGLIANSRRDPVVYVDLGNFVGIAWAHLRDVYASEGWAYLERTRCDH